MPGGAARVRRGWARVGVGLIAAAMAAGLVMALPYLSPGPVERAIAIGARPAALAVDARAGRVLVTAYGDDMLRIYDARSLSLVRSLPLDTPTGPLAVDEQSGRAFVVTGGGASLTVVDTRSGQMLRSLSANLAEQPALAVDPGSNHVFVTTEDGVLLLDGRSGAVLRRVRLGVAPDALAGLAVDATAGRALVVDHNDGQVIVLDTRSGRVVRTVPVGLGPTSVVVDARTGRALVVNANENSLSLFDPHGGATRRLATEAGAVAAGSGHLFVASERGNGCETFSMLDASSGRALHTACVDAAGSSAGLVAVDAVSGRVFVAGDSGVSVLAARSGMLLRTTLPGLVAATALAVDESGGRAFVLGQWDAVADQAQRRHTAMGALDAWSQWLWQRLPWLPRPAGAAGVIPTGTGVMGVVDATK